MNALLSRFERLMVGVTFAEANLPEAAREYLRDGRDSRHHPPSGQDRELAESLRRGLDQGVAARS